MLPLLISRWTASFRRLVLGLWGRSHTHFNAVEGQGLAEYGLILVLVAVAVVAILAVMGPTLGNMFSNIVCNVFEVQHMQCIY